MLSQILTITKYTIIELIGNRLLLLNAIILVISVILLQLLGEITITESRVTQLAIVASFLRISAVIIVMIMVISSMVTELRDKILEMILAKSVSRTSYYLGKLSGYLIMALFVSILFSLLIVFFADFQQSLIWGSALFLELSIVVAISMVMLISFNQIPSALFASLIFYSVSRLMGAIALLSKYPLLPHDSLVQKFMDMFIVMLSFLLPNLQKFTQVQWLSYNTAQWQDLFALAGQAIIYVILLSYIALFDLYRKNF